MNTEQQTVRARTIAAMRQARVLLARNGINVKGKKLPDQIRIFARLAGYGEIESPRTWLLDLWASQADDRCAKVDAPFYLSDEWVALRAQVLDKYGTKCMKCGKDDRASVDHIKPKSLYPELALDIGNLQVLCRPCNSSKGARSNEDYRPG